MKSEIKAALKAHNFANLFEFFAVFVI